MKYVILSLKHGTPDSPMFWRSDNAGYTNSPFAAGIYTAAQVLGDPEYYNNGYSTVAIPLTDQAMGAIDFKCSFNLQGLENFWQQSQIKSKNIANGK
jgi:hypothetical protein